MNILVFTCSNYEEWYLKLIALINVCNKGKKLPYVNGLKYNINLISNQEFQKVCETGDILLFNTKSLSGRIQRLVTGNHVGLILKAVNGEIYLLDATSKTGVSTTKWGRLILDWQNIYHQVVFRKLIFQRNNDNLLKLDKYIKAIANIEIDRQKVLDLCV